MKEERLQNWDKKEELDCLLFFALRIRELVFDYTLDTFKYPALNSTASCKEAIELINEIESNIISVKSLEPIVAELQWKIRQDYVVKKMVGEDIQYYLNFGDIANHKEIKLKLQLLYNKISPNKYCLVTEDLLEKIIAENKEKKTISKLAATYVSSLINLGFSQSYIYITTNNHFFSTTSINNLDSLRNFFSCFTRVQETYTVILRCSNLFLELSKSSFAFRSEISNTITDDISKLDKHGFTRTKQKNESFFIANEIKALDPVSAKTEAERRINKLSKLFVFYHHKKHPTWLSKALVINNKSKNTFLLDNRVSPMSKGRDLEPQKAAIELNKLIRGLELDSESFAKYDRAIDLHGLSIENKYIENQLLQNWIAFETLLVGYSSKSKIDQVLDHLVPFLKYKYIERTIREFSKDLMRQDQVFFSKQLKKIIIGENLTEKTAALITLDAYKTNRVEIYKHLEMSPLLKWRLSQFHDFFGSPKGIKEFLGTHELKIIWQIKRMYRTRNLVVHAGIIPDYTETLVENSHTYLDLLISTINDLSINGNQIRTIEQAIEEISIRVKKHERYLRDFEGKSIDEKNYVKLIFGH